VRMGREQLANADAQQARKELEEKVREFIM
jgi:hypothetical protein